MAKRFLLHLNSSARLSLQQDSYRRLVTSILNRCLCEGAKAEKDEKKKSGSADDLTKEGSAAPPSKFADKTKSQLKARDSYDEELVKHSSDDDDASGGKWKVELAWFSKALEPALQLYKWAAAGGSNEKQITPPTTRSIAEIMTKLQQSKAGVQDWGIGDLTIGLYLLYLSRASSAKIEDFNGVQITSDVAVQQLIYHIELAKGAYKDNPTILARHSMLRERNILKFVKHSSVLRPGYYIGIDTRNKLVIFGIRGTHTVYDFITDVVSTSDQEMSIEGFSTHFGTAEAAQWYLRHEMGTIRKCLEKYKDFRLRIVGHSLGGAAAALLAIMLRKKSKEELGFDPDIVSAVGFGTPPCVSKALAENCASYVSTVVLQDDIVPRLSVASLTRLRNEIVETEWMTVLEKEDWKGIVDLVTNAKQFVSLVQDVARRVADYTKLSKMSESSDMSTREDLISSPRKPELDAKTTVETDRTARKDLKRPESDSRTAVELQKPVPEELFIPGTVYFLKRNVEEGSGTEKSREYYTLWKRDPGEHFQKILFSGNFISDHGCDSHFYALRDVLKSLPASDSIVYF